MAMPDHISIQAGTEKLKNQLELQNQRKPFDSRLIAADSHDESFLLGHLLPEIRIVGIP